MKILLLAAQVDDYSSTPLIPVVPAKTEPARGQPFPITGTMLHKGEGSSMLKLG